MYFDLNNISEKILEQPIFKIQKVSISVMDLFYVGIVIAIAYAIFLSAKLFVNLQIKRQKIRSAQGKTLLQLFGYIVIIVAVANIFSVIGYSLTYLLVGSTALLVGLGFGLQQLFLDLVSGVILLIDRNINLGDVVRVDIPTTMYGKIIHIGVRTTQLQTIDNEIFVIPNNKFLASGIKSLMRDNGPARFRVHIQIGFESDMELAKKILITTALGDERVEKDLYPTVIIKDFQDNGVLLEVRFWMKELFNSEIILSDIRFKILEEFRKNNIEIPYPKREMISVK